MQGLGAQEAKFRNQVASNIQWISEQLHGMALRLAIPAVQKDCKLLAGAVDHLEGQFQPLLANIPAEYAEVAHKLNGATNAIVLKIGILKHAMRSEEEREWHLNVEVAFQTLISLFRRFLEAYDPTRSIPGSVLEGVVADPRVPLQIAN